MIVNSMTGLAGVESDTWPSTGAIDVETNSLDLSIKQLAADWFRTAPDNTADPGLLAAWNTFIADWSQWRDAAWFWNPTRRDELLGYRKRFNDFLTRFNNAGVGSLAMPQATSGLDALDKAGDLLTKAMWVVGGIGALWAANTVYKTLRR